MDRLNSLVEQQVGKLSGAQFKLAAYLYWRLEQEPELTIRSKDLAALTGLSIGATQSASNSLAKLKVLDVIGGPGKTKTYRLPQPKAITQEPGGLCAAESPSSPPAPCCLVPPATIKAEPGPQLPGKDKPEPVC